MSSVFLFDHEEDSNRKINIDDLYERRQKRDLKQISIFNKILGRIHKRINHTARNKNTNETFIWFNVPEYLVGEPIYDKGECIGYIVSELEKNGFHIKYVHPNALFVSWHNWVPSYVRNEIKKKMGVVIDEKGNVIDKVDNPETNEILNRAQAMSQAQNPNQAQTQNANQKQYTPIGSYKPSGNLVYGPDILAKLEKKITFGA
jgi:hypothetical protein